MNSRKTSRITLVVLSGIIAATLASCVTMSAHRRPNLEAARSFVARAIAQVDEAQRANAFDLQGHAAKAKTLLVQASDEIAMALQASTKR